MRHAAPSSHPGDSPRLVLAALGVVFGDIGTSPLYALRECFHGPPRGSRQPRQRPGRAVAHVLVADRRRLGQVPRFRHAGRQPRRGRHPCALMALVRRAVPGRPRSQALLIGLGLFGAALLYGDGIITPAISVLGAVEGLNVATPLFTPYVVPMASPSSLALFLVQRAGTAAVGAMFGPVMLVWFVDDRRARAGRDRARARPCWRRSTRCTRLRLLRAATACTGSWCSARSSWS